MRAWLALPLLVACGYDEPKDRCEGTCAVYALDRATATPGDVITLEGNFDRDMAFTFPGSASAVKLDEYGPHRATLIVPADATAGDLVGLGNSGYTEPVPFRATSFEHELQPFRNTYEQTSGGRFLGAAPTFARAGAAVLSAGNRLFLIGGQGSAGLLDSVDLLLTNADGTISEPYGVTTKLTVGRADHASVVIGPNVFVIGGRTAAGSTDTIEGATLDPKFDLGPFGAFDARLTVAREGLAVAVVGNYVYAIGGNHGGTEVAELERAPIYDTGLIGTFEPLGDLRLAVPRSGHTVAVVGKYLYVIGGFANGSPVKETERFELGADAFIGEPSTNVGNLVTARGRHMTTVVGDSIYVIGGSTGLGTAIDSVERARLDGNFAWQTVDTLKLGTARAGGVLAAVGNHVYAMGGTDAANAPLTTFERASIIGHAGQTAQIGLESFAPTTIVLPEPRNYPSTLVVGNTLYIIGGATSSGPTQSISSAKILADGTLSAFEPAGVALNRKRMAHAASVYGNTYCVYGGVTTPNLMTFESTIECAPIEASGRLGTFQMAGSAGLDQPRGYISSIVHQRQVFVFGGIGAGQMWLDVVGKLPLPPTTTATLETALPATRSHLVPLVLPTTAFLMSGLTSGTPATVSFQGSYAGPSLGGWSGVSANPAASEGTTLVVAGDAVFAIGGGGSASGTQRAVIDADDGVSAFASTSSNLTQQRYGHAAVSIGDRVYVIGGTTGIGTLLDSVEMSRIH